MFGDIALRHVHRDPAGLLVLSVPKLLESPLVATMRPMIDMLLAQSQDYRAITAAMAFDPLRDLDTITLTFTQDIDTMGLVGVGRFDELRFLPIVKDLFAQTSDTSLKDFVCDLVSGVFVYTHQNTLPELKSGFGVRAGSAIDMSLAVLDTSLPLYGVVAEPSKLKSDRFTSLPKLEGIEKVTLELALAAGISLRVGVVVDSLSTANAIWSTLDVAARAALSALRARILSEGTLSEEMQAMLDELLSSLTFDLSGSTVWIRFSVSTELLLASITGGLFTEIVTQIRKQPPKQ